MQLSENDLNENASRLSQTIEELQYCLGNLIEEKDELESTNAMLKDTIQGLLPPLKGRFRFSFRPIRQIFNKPAQVFRKSNSDRGRDSDTKSESEDSNKVAFKSQVFINKIEEAKGINVVSQMISEEISMPIFLKPSQTRSDIINLPRGRTVLSKVNK